MRRLVALALPLLAFASCAQPGTYALVSFDAVGTAPTGIKSIDLQLMLGTASASTTIHAPSGDITLPTTASLQIRTGSGTLQVNASALDDAGNVIGTGSGSATVKTGASTPIHISFAFATPGAAVLQIDHQPSFDFGTVPLTTQSSAATFTVTNSGSDSSGAIAAATLAGSGAGEFQITSDGCAGMTLAPMATCAVEVILAPTQTGKPTATLSVSAAPGGETSTSLTGNAVALGDISITPSPANFGTVLVPSGASDQTLTVTNSGGAATGAMTMSLNGSDATQFSITGGTCADGMTLAPSASCTATVHFAPTSAGSKTASFQVDATPGGPGVANLTGVGQTPAMLAFSMGSYTVSGNIAAGSTGSVTLTLLNQGTQDSGPLPALALSGDPSFTITGGTCQQGNVVAASSSCTVVVTFTPTTYGARSAALSIAASPGGTATTNIGATGQQTFTLTVNKTGSTGNGTISSTPAGDINCDTSDTKCTMTYTVSTTVPSVTLHAAPDASSVFSGWSASNDCAAYGTGDCQLTMSGNKTATGLFTAQVTLTVSFAGGGAGTVVIQPGGKTCTAPTSCSATFNSGTSVSLTAKTNNGSNSVVSGWSGACAGNGPARVCTLTLTSGASTTVTLSTLPANLVFVTSQTYTGNLGGAAAAQTDCNTLATAAGINNAAGNAYVAWLATSSYTPVSLIGSSRGWVRADLLPWIDNMSTALSSGIVYYPAAYDENGQRVYDNTLSGMNGNGTVYTGYNCSDWSVGDSTASASHGHTHASGLGWPFNNVGISSCGNLSRLLCVMSGGTAPVSPTPVTGKKVWLTKSAWAPGAGIASANSKCLSDAPAGVSAAKAILVASTQALTDVLGSTTVYVRPDGVRAGTGSEIISALNNYSAPATIEGGIIQDGGGNYIAGNYPVIHQVWTGVTYNGTADKDTCRDWLSSASTDSGTIGNPTGWYVAGKDGAFACNTALIFLRCAEQ